MVLGIADDSYADAEASGDSALGDGIGGVVGALGVDVGTQVVEELLDVGLAEKHDVIDSAESGDQRGSGGLWKNWAAGPFQGANAGIGIHGDDQEVAFAARAFEIADVPDVQGVEAAVGEDNFAAVALVAGKDSAEFFAGDDFGFGGAHSLRS